MAIQITPLYAPSTYDMAMAPENDCHTRKRALSRKEYLDTLVRPSTAEIQRITEIQLQKEQATAARYHTAEERDAAKMIQRAYRGHRERRQLNGLTLDPSSRWVEILKEWQYRSATAPHLNHIDSRLPDGRGRSKSTSEQARMNWRRAEAIAKHAGAGESSPTAEQALRATNSFGSRRSRADEPGTMLLDLRYFLEMVDTKHRYGANLQVYHEEWQKSKTDQNFFHWLDHGAGRRVSLTMCSREKLEKERIRYLSKEERKDYLVRVDDEGKLRWAKNDELITTSDQYQDSMHGIVPKGSSDPTYSDTEVKEEIDANASLAREFAAAGGLFRDTLLSDNASQYDEEDTPSTSPTSSSSSSTLEGSVAHQKVTKDKTPGVPKRKKFHASPATILNHLLRASVRPGTWIYVADTVGRLYVGIKSSGAFQHASFLSGARISSAGAIEVKHGQLIYLSPLSGHYRPTTKSFKRFLDNLRDQGVDMKQVKVSKSYAVLLGMECYGRSKKDLNRVIHPGDEEKRKKQREARRNARQVRRRERLERKMLKGGDLGTETASEVAIGTPGATLSAANEVERNWQTEHSPERQRRRGLSRLMDDLHIRRKTQLESPQASN